MHVYIYIYIYIYYIYIYIYIYIVTLFVSGSWTAHGVCERLAMFAIDVLYCSRLLRRLWSVWCLCWCSRWLWCLWRLWLMWSSWPVRVRERFANAVRERFVRFQKAPNVPVDHPEGKHVSWWLWDFSARAGLDALAYEISLRSELRSPNISEKI